MTRGTIYTLLSNNKVVNSCEFNGDMYGGPESSKELQENGRYREVIEFLKDVNDEKTFKVAVKKFDKENFNYQDEEGGYFRFYHKELKDISFKGMVDMREGTYFKLFFSDYLFFKNCSGKEVSFKDSIGKVLNVKESEVIIFNFGRFVEIK